ncbi:MAG: hypothetical protein AB7F64_07470 [Gammaproteobacteria bacterium]
MFNVSTHPTIDSKSVVPTLSTFQTSNLAKNALLPVYLVGRSVTIVDKKTSGTYKACCVSFTQNLVFQKDLNLSELIEGKRIGAIHIENHKIKSLTVTSEMLEIFKNANIKGITILQGHDVLSVEDEAIIRAFVSEEQYKKFTMKLI